MLNKRPKLEDVLAVFAILAAALVVYAPVLAPGRTLLPTDLLLITPPWSAHSSILDPNFTHVLRRTWDPLFQFYPSRKFLSESLLHGIIPLWNPHVFGGTPFAADGQSAVFYPPNWLFAVLPLAFAFSFVAFLHTFLTGLFFYLFGRRVGWSATGAAAGAAVWMFCGVQVGWQMWQVVDSTICWLPLCLYFWEGLRAGHDNRSAISLSAALAMTLLAGHLQFAFYVLVTVISYAIYRPIPGERQHVIHSITCLAGCVLLSMLLSAVQILATADFLRLSIRISIPIAQLLPTALPPAQLGLVAMPELFGGERDYLNHTFLAGEYYEKVVYCGASALVFAAFGCRLGRSGDLSRFWAGLAIFSVLMGCGSPLYAAFYYVVPLYKSFHGLSRAFVLFDFAVACLAAHGVSWLSVEEPRARKRTAQISTGVVALAALVAYRFGVLGNGKTISYILTHDWFSFSIDQALTALALVISAGLILTFSPRKASVFATLLVFADMLVFAVGLNPGGSASLLYPPTTETSFVSQKVDDAAFSRVLCLADSSGSHPQSRITPNGAMSLGWNDVSGSNPLILNRYNDFISLVNTSDTKQTEPDGQGMIAEAGNPALNPLNVRFLITPSIVNIPGYQLSVPGAVNVYENTSADGPDWLVPLTNVNFDEKQDDSDQKFLLNSKFEAVVSDIGSQKPAVSSVSARSMGSGSTELHSNDDGGIDVAVHTVQPSLLVISQTYCPGWTALVDGSPTRILPVDGLLCGIKLPPGDHSVKASYLPTSILVGMYLTCCGWLIIGFSLAQRIAINLVPRQL